MLEGMAAHANTGKEQLCPCSLCVKGLHLMERSRRDAARLDSQDCGPDQEEAVVAPDSWRATRLVPRLQ